jgi:hypothetical protein
MVSIEDVRIKHGNTWISANEMQTKAYKNYKQRYIERPLTTLFHIYSDGTYYEQQIPVYMDTPSPSSPSNALLDVVKTVSITISKTDNNSYMPTYITEKITTYEPMQLIEPMQPSGEYGIIDFNDIKLFLIRAYSQASWVDVRPYQAWAYIDFVYSNVEIKHYASRGSYVLDDDDGGGDGYISRRIYTLIDINTSISPNIIFSIKRNRDNGSVSFVRENGEQVRICDDERARAGYRGFYTRMTMDVGMIIEPPVPSSHHVIPSTIPTATETDIEDDQCILCCKYKKNITFSPCNHNIVCSCCYIKLDKGKECPMCKGTINEVNFI